jgi:hypothetical protein
MTKNFKKITAGKLLYIYFGSKIAIYLSLGLHEGRISYRRSLQPLKDNIQHFKNMKIENSFTFSMFVGLFSLLDPEPATQIIADPCGSGSSILAPVLRIRIRDRCLFDPWIRDPE